MQLQLGIMSKSYLCYCALLVAVSAGAFGQQHLIGGPKEIDVTKSELAENALIDAVHEHNLNTTEKYQTAVSKVLSAQVQVVQGFKYTFTVIMAETNCTKDAVNKVCTIPQHPDDAQMYICKFTVWSRLWLNSTIVTEKCIR